MPGIDGIELLNRILEKKIKVPTVVMSAGSSKAIETQAKTRGARSFLRKPFSGKELLEVVNSSLKGEDDEKPLH